MAFPLSPGITSTERDLTTSVPAVATTEGGIALVAHWGPADEPTLVTDPDDMVRKFGKPDSTTAPRWFCAEDFLSSSRALYVVRGLTALSKNAVSSGTAIQIKNDTHYDDSYSDGEGTVGMWAAKYPGKIGNSLFVGICTSASKYNATGANEWKYTKLDGTVIKLSSLFDSAPGTSVHAAEKGSSNDELHVIVIDHLGEFTGTPGQVLEKYSFLSVASDAKKEDGTSNYYKTVINRSSPHIRWMNHATVANPPRGSITIVDEDPDVSFTIGETITGGNSGATGTLIAINDALTSMTLSNVSGTFENGETLTGGTSSETVVTGGTLVLESDWGTALAENNVYTNLLDDDTDHAIQLIGGTNDSGSLTSALSGAYDKMNDPDTLDISFVIGGDADSTIATKIYDTVVLRKDCVGVLSPEKSHVVNNSGSEKTDVLAYRDGLSFGGANDLKPSYMVIDDNWKYVYNRFDDTYIWVPCNGAVAGIMAETDKEEGAGFSPGGKGIRNTIKLAWSAKKPERDELYKKGINSIANFPGEGAVLYGDKTMMTRPSAFDRINVRRIFIEMKKTISKSARSFMFKNNNAFTRNRFLSTVRPYLEGKKGRGEITDFRVVCDSTNNTSDVISRNEFVGDIYIKPAYSINFIQLNFVAVDINVEFEELIKGL